MRKIKKLSNDMLDEICSAKSYAECYVDEKSKGNTQWANRFKEMSNDELKHANYLHELITSEIERLRAIYTPPQEMLEKWEHDHKKYVDKVAWVKQMLSL